MSSGPQKCPACDLLNPPATQNCDCGYPLQQAVIDRARAVSTDRLTGISLLYQLAGIAAWIGERLSRTSVNFLPMNWLLMFGLGIATLYALLPRIPFMALAYAWVRRYTIFQRQSEHPGLSKQHYDPESVVLMCASGRFLLPEQNTPNTLCARPARS